ncbi:MAG: 2-oxo acid dehydrogenase subunit E2 [Calditrichaeota bacterium]|nr:2-oxo acid dehydrogenase subunit E2 [Calditrichota bacterium]
MKVEMIMPQMGESIAEGTIVKWRKGVGDKVERDEDILEISTDKVDSEIPSPATGTIVDILVQEGKTVAIKTPLAVIETEAGAEVSGTAAEPVRAASSVEEPPVAAGRPPAQESSPHDGSAEGGFTVREFKRSGEGTTPAAPLPTMAGSATVGADSHPPVSKTSNFLSPLVQRIAADEGVSMNELQALVGTGDGGRVTKKDLLAYIEERKNARALPPAPAPVAKVVSRAAPASSPVIPSIAPAAIAPSPAPSGQVWVGAGDQVVEMDRMRRAIADHMVRSKQTSPHVISFAEVDMSRIVRHREGIKNAFKAQEGVNITYTSYFIHAAARALREFPYINASVDGYSIIVRRAINIGFAVELPSGGLIVPVIKGVDALSLTGIAKGLNDLADKARSNRLSPDDVSGGTFTITNVGVFGNVSGAPIINQPQVAILGTGAIKKRAVVVETEEGDHIAIKPIMVMSLSYDHRLIDGALAGRFMSRLGQILETFEG